MRRGSAFGAALVFALAGCSGVLGLGEPDLSISLGLQRAHSQPPTLRVDVGGRRVDVVAKAAQNSVDIRAPRYGAVPVGVALLTPAGDTLAAARFTQRYQRNHKHWVSALVGARRPVGHCIGELIVTPLRSPGSEAAPDSLFLMYGSIPEGAIC